MSRINLDQQSILVSFVIPTHNRAELLQRCLDSVISQTHKNLEIIVVNDNSTDNTDKVLESYKRKDDRIVTINNKGTGGNAARNTGIFAAKGEYIALMDDDDTCMPNRVEKQLGAVVNSNFKYDFIISGYEMRKPDGTLVKTVDYLKPMESIGLTIRWFVKTNLLKKINGFDIEQPSLQEVELFWRLKEASKIYFDPSIVVTIRGAEISITKDSDKMKKGIERLLDLHGSKMSKKEYNNWIRSLCGQAAKKKDWKLFFSELKRLKFSSLKLLDLLLIFSGILHSFNIYKIYRRILDQSYKNKKIRDYKLL